MAVGFFFPRGGGDGKGGERRRKKEGNDDDWRERNWKEKKEKRKKKRGVLKGKMGREVCMCSVDKPTISLLRLDPVEFENRYSQC